jgi:hypothetical protein
MVNKVALPEDDSADIARQTIDVKVWYRAFYDQIQDDLLDRIQAYTDVNGDPALLEEFSIRKYTEDDEEAVKRKKTLIGLYSPAKDKYPYKQLEKLRKKNGLVICPSCGELGRPRTLDHYLPKDIYPELSFTLVNLTPMCDWCQGEKGTKYIDNGQKVFIHPYFDNVDRPLLRLIFFPPFETPIIEINTVDGLDGDLDALIKRHIAGVDFSNRYKENFKTAYLSVLRAARSCQEGGTSLDKCLEVLLIIESGKGPNSWDAILYRSVLADGALMGFLEKGILPEYI